VQVKTETVTLADIRSAIFLKWMTDASKVLTPEVVDEKITYPDVTRLVPTVEPLEFLDRLAAQGILIKEKHVSEILCPSCGSSELRDRYTCMFCRGDNLDTGEMIEHYACGNTDFETSFQKEEKLICAKCRKELKIIGTDHRRVGKVFKCNDCGKESSVPRIAHTCQNCGTASTWEQVRLRVLYKYRINQEKKKEIDSLTGIYLPLVEFLQKAGFQVESPALLRGESGVEHSFDISAISEGRRTLFDMVSDTESVSEAAVIAFFSKTLDLTHNKAVLICVPKASQRARGLCKLYGIDLVEGNEITEILNSIATQSLKGEGATGSTVQPDAPAHAVSTQVHSTPPQLRSPTSHAPAKLSGSPQIISDSSEVDIEISDLRARISALDTGTTEPKERAPVSELRALHSKISALAETIDETLDRADVPLKMSQLANQSARNAASNAISLPIEPSREVMEHEKLKALEDLYRSGKMGEEEYRRNKKRILSIFGAG